MGEHKLIPSCLPRRILERMKKKKQHICTIATGGAGVVTCYMVRLRDGSSDETEGEEKQGGLGVCRGDGRTARGAGWTEHEEARLRTKGNPLLKAHPFRATPWTTS